MANATILSIGGVTVTAAGGLTGQLLSRIATLFRQDAVETTIIPGDLINPTIPGPDTASGLPQVLVIPSDDTGVISIPAGYDYVFYTGAGSLKGGGANTAVVGNDLTYSGQAGTVIGTSGHETVTDSAPDGTFAFYSGNYILNTGGDGTTLDVDTAASGTMVVTGSGDTINLGTPPDLRVPSNGNGAAGSPRLSATSATSADVSLGVNTIIVVGTSETTSISAASNVIFVTSIDVVNQSGGSSTVMTGHGSIVTLDATGGTQVVFDNPGDTVGNTIDAGPMTEFVGAVGAAASTFESSAGGADTVFAGTAINYQGSAAATSLFLGGAGAATVFAGATATLFGGTGGGTYHEGIGSFLFWGSGGSDALPVSDIILGAANAANVTVWGDNNENTTVSQLGAATGGVYVAFGASDTLNAADARGGNVFFVVDQTLPSGANFSGNTTLVGSSAGHDSLAVFAETATAAHTITIENWQASDNLILSGFGAADMMIGSQALAAALGGSTQFTLSDNTTINFVGTSPTSHS